MYVSFMYVWFEFLSPPLSYTLLVMLCPPTVLPPQLRSVLSVSLMCTHADKDQSNVQVASYTEDALVQPFPLSAVIRCLPLSSVTEKQPLNGCSYMVQLQIQFCSFKCSYVTS